MLVHNYYLLDKPREEENTTRTTSVAHTCPKRKGEKENIFRKKKKPNQNKKQVTFLTPACKISPPSDVIFRK